MEPDITPNIIKEAMKRITSFLLFVIVLTPSILKAQVSSLDGFYLGGALMGEAWTLPDLDVDSESGAGFGLKLGYNFSPSFGVFTSLDGAVINPDVGEDYELGHFDLGLEGRISSVYSNFLPYGRISFLGMAVAQDDPGGDIEITGSGLGLGVGFYVFLSQNLALDVSLTKSWVNLSEVSVGSSTVEVDEDAESGRFGIGLVYHF